MVVVLEAWGAEGKHLAKDAGDLDIIYSSIYPEKKVNGYPVSIKQNAAQQTLLIILDVFFLFFFLTLTSTFQLLDKPWSQVSSLLPPGSCLQFYCAQGSAIPLLVDISASVANSRSRAFRKSICAQEKVPTNSYEYALGGIRTHETDLYQARE